VTDPRAAAETTAETTGEGRDALGRLLLFGLLTAAIVLADQLTKAVVDSSFGLSSPSPFAPGEPIVPPTPILGGFLQVAKTYNSGAIFGYLQSTATVFALGTLVVAAAIVWYEVTRGWRGPLLLTIALGFLLGGAIGNLIDRLRVGYVIDFADMGIGSVRWYSFNVADASVSIAIVLIVVVGLFGGWLERRGSEPPAAPRGADG
jgi:signal peptidase II